MNLISVIQINIICFAWNDSLEVFFLVVTIAIYISELISLLLQRRNLYQKKNTMNSTDNPAPIATHDVALRDVASFRNWADCAAKLLDFEYSSVIKEIRLFLRVRMRHLMIHIYIQI